MMSLFKSFTRPGIGAIITQSQWRRYLPVESGHSITYRYYYSTHLSLLLLRSVRALRDCGQGGSLCKASPDSG